jgi:hypothetical protein
MMISDSNNSNLCAQVVLAMAGAAAIAHQVTGKAVGDGFFLQYYAVSALPTIVLVAAIASVTMAIGFSRLTERFGPMPLVPFSFALSAVLHATEWLLLPSAPRVIAAVFYLHADCGSRKSRSY